jgi:hypothetical protein
LDHRDAAFFAVFAPTTPYVHRNLTGYSKAENKNDNNSKQSCIDNLGGNLTRTKIWQRA